MTSRDYRRLARLEASLLEPTDSPEEALRRAFALLPDADLKKVEAALSRLPDGADRISRELLTPEEAESFDKLSRLIELQGRG
jgi:hypothetical protein